MYRQTTFFTISYQGDDSLLLTNIYKLLSHTHSLSLFLPLSSTLFLTLSGTLFLTHSLTFKHTLSHFLSNKHTLSHSLSHSNTLSLSLSLNNTLSHSHSDKLHVSISCISHSHSVPFHVLFLIISIPITICLSLSHYLYLPLLPTDIYKHPNNGRTRVKETFLFTEIKL
jgi:hypothetical protein